MTVAVKTTEQIEIELNRLRSKGLIVNALDDGLPYDSEEATGIVTFGDSRWHQRSSSWYGPQYPVRWKIGDHVGQPIGPWPGLGHATIQCSHSNGNERPDNGDNDIAGVPQYDFDDNSTSEHIATTNGTGVIFLVQAMQGFPRTPD